MVTQMKNLMAVGIGALLLVGCGSMHPPTTNPYFPGYHTRDVQDVEEEYQAWEEEQVRREQRARVRDSLDAEYEAWYRDWLMNGNFTYQQYNFYRDRYPYHRRYNRGYYPHSGWNFSFRYSNQPWFVDTWWADDYLWDQYFWGSRWYSGYPYYGYYDSYYNSFYYDPFFTNTGYYDPYYGYWHHKYPGQYYVIEEDNTPTGPRPANRGIFTRGSGGGGSVTPNVDNSNTIRPVNPNRPGGRSITPAVIDRDKIQRSNSPVRRPINRGRASAPVHDSDDGNQTARSPSPAYSPPATSSRNRSSSSSSSSSTTVRRKASSNDSGGSKSSSSSNDSSSKSKKRPKNRRH